MANKDNRKQARFVDQPGQWKDVTKPEVKSRQNKAWEKLLSGNGNKTGTKKK